jgi:acyl dehydratase
MAVADASGRTYGPVAVPVTPERAAAFVAATGDDPRRWSEHAPPSFAAAALFGVAPSFLEDPDVAPDARSVIHTEQVFRWRRALGAGETLSVLGRVTGVRARRHLNLVSFDLAAAGEDGEWMDGSASFLMSPEAAAAGEEEPEPAHDDRAASPPAREAPLPAPGEPLPELPRSASRADLVRYAAASGDWNPIHWDHGAAVAAGLPGVVVHGLLMASWMVQAAARHAPGPHPVSEIRLRFRKPLRPAVPAIVGGTAGEERSLSLELASGEELLVSALARVTP